MRVLFDKGTPAPLRHALSAHIVETAYERGWSRLKNSELIVTAEAAGFEVFATTGKNLKYEQNSVGRHMAIAVLQTSSWPRLRQMLPQIIDALATAVSGRYSEVETHPR